MFFSAFGWTPEILLDRTERELVAYSKLICKDQQERRKFDAAIHNMKIELPNAPSEIDPEVQSRMDAMLERTARKHGFSK